MSRGNDGALHDAAIKGDVARLNAILDSGVDINERFGSGTALIIAASAGRAKTVRVLLERGADVDLVDQNNSTALTWATRYGLQMDEPEGGVTVVRLLLEYGADANHIDDGGETPLVLAATEGNIEAIHVFLDHGVNVNAMTEYGTTALIAASTSLEAAKVLLEAGADVNRGPQGWTALRSAVHNSDIDCVKLFLAFGADPSMPNADGDTPLDMAKAQNNSEIIGLLIDATRSRG